MKSSNNANSVKKMLSLTGIGVLGALAALPVLAETNLRPGASTIPAQPEVGQTTPDGIEPPTAPAAAPLEAPTSAEAPTGTVVDIAVANDSFTTLTAALETAGLTDVLQGEGPFTVFAPTNEAFAALPEGTVEALLLPENRDMLIQILSYHVLPERVTSGDLASGEVSTVEGSSINVEVDATGVTVNDANVVQPDIEASNGVIHVIDQVILPPGV